MKQYRLVRYEKNPFDKSDVSDGSLILCDKDGQPYASLYSDYEWLKEGDVLNETELKFETVGKRSKHLVVGDVVIFGLFEGEIAEIIEHKSDDWKDTFRLINCKETHGSGTFRTPIKKKIKCESTMEVARKDATAKQWVTAQVRCPHCKKF